MLPLPKWAKKILENTYKKCPSCNSGISNNEVIISSVGICSFSEKEDLNDIGFSFQFVCKKCESESTVKVTLGSSVTPEALIEEINKTIKNYRKNENNQDNKYKDIDAFDVFEEFEEFEEFDNQEEFEDYGDVHEEKKDTFSNITGSKISDREFNEAINIIRNSKNHDDFLIKIGLNQEHIDKYKFKKRKKRKGNQ